MIHLVDFWSLTIIEEHLYDRVAAGEFVPWNIGMCGTVSMAGRKVSADFG